MGDTPKNQGEGDRESAKRYNENTREYVKSGKVEKAAREAGKRIHVYADETRPLLQGARLTTWELQQRGIEVTLICDSMAAQVMREGRIQAVVTGADRIAANGDVANKIGTYLKALAAKDNQIPFYVALPSSTFDWQIRDGVKEILIEERPGEEIKRVTGLSESGRLETVAIAPPATATANYAFDVTPARLITGLITERGLCGASEEEILTLYPEKKREER